MPVATSSSIQRQPFQQMLGVELPARQEKPPAPRPGLGAPAPELGVGKLSFGLLETLCPPELVDRVIKEAGREGKRNRLLPPRLVVYALLLMCLSGTMVTGGLRRNLPTKAVKWQSPAGRSAFGKACMRLGSEVMDRLFGALPSPVRNRKLDADWCFWHERRVVAIDGTTFPLPVNEELETEFGGQIGKDSSKPRVGVPQARMVSLIECGTRALLSVALGAYKEGEGSLARQLANALEPGMMVLADRCFPAKALWQLYIASGADLLWRVKGNLARRHLCELGDGSYLVNFGKRRPVQIRVIEYRRQGHPEIYRLITNLLDPVSAPARELAILYSQRWEIELAHRELKCDQADQAPLRSKTADGVRQEIYAHCLLHTLNRQLVYTAAATTSERAPDRISFTVAMDLLQLSLRKVKTAGRRAMAELSQWAINELVACDPLIRRARSCPRAVYRKLNHFINRARWRGPKSTNAQTLEIILRAA